VTGGDVIGSAADEVYDPATETFVAEPVPSERVGATATLLPSGDALVLGWLPMDGTFQPLSQAYRVSADTVVPTGPQVIPGRTDHTTTALVDGTLLVAGGLDGSNDAVKTELFDPATRTFTAGPDGPTTLTRHTATLLDDGRVLFAGGSGGPGVPEGAPDVFLYDPDARRFRGALPLTTPRAAHAAAVLPGGKVLITGGYDDVANVLRTAEIFDPKTNACAPIESEMLVARAGHKAVPLASGDVLVVGGATNVAERFDVRAQKFVPVSGLLSKPRKSAYAVLLASGEVLVVGDENADTTAELYDPRLDAFHPVPDMPAIGLIFGAVLLPCGRVLVHGGAGLDLYSPEIGTFVRTGTPACPNAFGTATLLVTGEVLVTGCSSASSASVWAEQGTSAARAPSLDGVGATVVGGSAIPVTGARLRGVTEASSGVTAASNADFPIAAWLPVARGGVFVGGFSDWSPGGARYTAPITALAGPGFLVPIAGGVVGRGTPVTVAAAAVGSPCTSPLECASGHCVDGVCCDDACSTVCLACSTKRKHQG
jgi:Kelch motif